MRPSTASARAAHCRTRRIRETLHDSIGHTLTATTIQAALAGDLVASDPDQARRAMDSIEETSRTALEDLDHMLGVLREGTPPREPHYTLADLEALLDRIRHAGVSVDARVTGDRGRVPAPVSREAYRIVQEGLTNAMRHPGPITVRIDVGPHRLDIELTNPIGTEGSRNATSPRGGRGLAGITERVHVLRGEVTAGPVTESADRHWRLAAWLPLESRP
ncbi:hypothetical protein JOL79_20745 [Microbispora sp. RL4-1S]|uniref:histidine kinase n=1 Tax=Microbispora oryzae TaxID=2806554 RepID=A0A941AKM7_9ACTN|nr:histidine kinase [Microbispora oryzae]MBP2706242.1 hypothetical protein [Microbispora oryzae]